MPITPEPLLHSLDLNEQQIAIVLALLDWQVAILDKPRSEADRCRLLERATEIRLLTGVSHLATIQAALNRLVTATTPVYWLSLFMDTKEGNKWQQPPSVQVAFKDRVKQAFPNGKLLYHWLMPDNNDVLVYYLYTPYYQPKPTEAQLLATVEGLAGMTFDHTQIAWEGEYEALLKADRAPITVA